GAKVELHRFGGIIAVAVLGARTVLNEDRRDVALKRGHAIRARVLVLLQSFLAGARGEDKEEGDEGLPEQFEDPSPKLVQIFLGRRGRSRRLVRRPRDRTLADLERRHIVPADRVAP